MFDVYSYHATDGVDIFYAQPSSIKSFGYGYNPLVTMLLIETKTSVFHEKIFLEDRGTEADFLVLIP